MEMGLTRWKLSLKFRTFKVWRNLDIVAHKEMRNVKYPLKKHISKNYFVTKEHEEQFFFSSLFINN